MKYCFGVQMNVDEGIYLTKSRIIQNILKNKRYTEREREREIRINRVDKKENRVDFVEVFAL